MCLLALLAGCGGDSDSSSSSNTDPDSSKAASSEYQGGERSVQGFGSEASGSEREAALSAFHAFLAAIAARDYGAACAQLAKPAIASLEQLASPQLGEEGCEAIVSKLLAASSAPAAAQQDEGKVTQVRVEGDQALVLFRAPGARLYVLSLIREGGDWKSSTLSASILVPEPAIG